MRNLTIEEAGLVAGGQRRYFLNDQDSYEQGGNADADAPGGRLDWNGNWVYSPYPDPIPSAPQYPDESYLTPGEGASDSPVENWIAKL